MPQPRCSASFAVVGPVPLNEAERGQLALVRIEIEAERSRVPMLVSLEMNRGVDPVAPALHRPPYQGHAFFWLERESSGLRSDIIAAAIMFDPERDTGLAENAGERIILAIREPEQTAVNVRKLIVGSLSE